MSTIRTVFCVMTLALLAAGPGGCSVPRAAIMAGEAFAVPKMPSTKRETVEVRPFITLKSHTPAIEYHRYSSDSPDAAREWYRTELVKRGWVFKPMTTNDGENFDATRERWGAQERLRLNAFEGEPLTEVHIEIYADYLFAQDARHMEEGLYYATYFGWIYVLPPVLWIVGGYIF